MAFRAEPNRTFEVGSHLELQHIEKGEQPGKSSRVRSRAVQSDHALRSGAHRLLVVDDDADIRKIFAEIGRRLGCEVETAGNADEFFSRYSQFQPDAVILDLAMGETDGIELMRRLAEHGSRAKILLVSGGESKMINAAEQLGESWKLSIQGSLQKPVPMANLERLLRKTFSLRPAVKEDELQPGAELGSLVRRLEQKTSGDIS